MVENTKLQSQLNQWKTEKFQNLTDYEEKISNLQNEIYHYKDLKMKLEKMEQMLSESKIELENADNL